MGPPRLCNCILVGIIVGVVVCLAIILICVLGLRRRKLKRANAKSVSEIKVSDQGFVKEPELDGNQKFEMEALPGQLPVGDERQEMDVRDRPQELEAVMINHESNSTPAQRALEEDSSPDS
jgi:hypothetical protein